MEKALPELNLHAAPMNPQPPQQDEEGWPSIEDLWATALEQDRTFNDIEGAIEAGSRASPPELKLQVTIAECSLDDKGKSRFTLPRTTMGTRLRAYTDEDHTGHL